MKKADIIDELKKKGIEHDPSSLKEDLEKLLNDKPEAVEEKAPEEKPEPVKVKPHVKRYYIKPHYLHKSVHVTGKKIALNGKTTQKDLKYLYESGHVQKIEFR